MSAACDHRALQRALVRLQLDPRLAARVLAREPAACASLRLREPDLSRLLALDAAALGADKDGKRRAQVLGNAAGEHRLSVALARAHLHDESFVEGFAESGELHAALASDGRLPLAFGAWAERRARELRLPALLELVRLERALCELRRAPRARPAPRGDEVVLAPRAEVLELARGTHALASALHELARRGAEPGAAEREARLDPRGREALLLLAGERPSPHRLPEVEVEPLEPAVAALLGRCRRPLGREARARLASLEGASSSELEAFVATLVDEGVLVRG